MNIAVIGANGRAGRIVVKAALARGHKVVAVTRTDEVSEPDDDNLTYARADVRSPGALTQALVGADAVVSALGARTSRRSRYRRSSRSSGETSCPTPLRRTRSASGSPPSPPPVDSQAKGDPVMASTTNLSDKTTIVVGASRGLGRGIATALAEAGAPVTAVARSETALDDLARAVSGIRPEVTTPATPRSPATSSTATTPTPSF